MPNKHSKKAPPKDPDALTYRQEEFCRAYVYTNLQEPDGSHKATQAAIQAGYSQKTANQQACRLLTYAKIQARISELRETIKERMELEAEDIIDAFDRMGTIDARSFYNEDGTAKQIHELTEEQGRVFQSVRRDNEGNVTGYVLPDRKTALDSAARCRGMFTDNVKVTENPEDKAWMEKLRDKVQQSSPFDDRPKTIN